MECKNDSLSALPNDVVRHTLNDIVKGHLKTENYSIQVVQGSAKGDNYIGIVYRAIVTNKDSKEKQMSIIIKVPPQNELRRKQFFARQSFLREALVYNEIIPMFMKFQIDRGIKPRENGFYEIPECYAALTEDNYEVIFMKDMNEEGYEMFNRFDKITFDHCQLVMKCLGKLHALSFAMKDQAPNVFAKYQIIKDIFIGKRNDENFNGYCDSLIKRALDTLCPEKDKNLLEKFQKFFEEKSFMDTLFSLINGETVEPYTVLCHGDCWNNNVLYKYKDGVPVSACLIDWQITRYASPVCDLMYFFFGCTTKEFRDKYYHKLIDVYHGELTALLRRLGSDPNKLFPRSALNQQLKDVGSFGLLMAVMVLPVFLSQSEDVPDLDDLAQKMEDGDVDVHHSFNSGDSIPMYRKRMRDVIVDMVELGYV